MLGVYPFPCHTRRELNEDYLQLGNEGYRLCTVAMALQATCSW